MSKQAFWTLDIVGGVCTRLPLNPFVLGPGNHQLNQLVLATEGKVNL